METTEKICRDVENNLKKIEIMEKKKLFVEKWRKIVANIL